MKPRYTDQHRWPRGYATSAQTGEAGYLKAKFDKLRIEQQNAPAKVTQITRGRSPCSEK